MLVELKNIGRTVRCHSSFYIGLYGSNWINFIEETSELVSELLTLSPNKCPFYQKFKEL